MSRRPIAAVVLAPLLALVAFAAFAPAAAQDGQTGSPPERIDLAITPPPPSRSTEEECKRQSEAAIVSGEIVVCGALPRESQRITSREDAQNRYAARTAFRDDPATPDVAGPGIFRGPATVSGICIKGFFNCPKPPAVFVDVAALPKAPPGSDADRISRGLEPLGQDAASAGAGPRSLSEQERAELGLPAPAPASASRAASAAEPPNPAGSAAPGAPR